MRKYLVSLFILNFVYLTAQNNNVYNIIPLPNTIKPAAGNFELSERTKIIAADTANYKDAIYLKNYLKEVYGLYVPVLTDFKNTTNAIVFNYDLTGTFKGEQYQLNVEPGKVAITALKGSSGFFYAIQTIFQLLPPYKNVAGNPALSKFNIPCVSIKDSPRFKYRGMHLDVCRHFFRKEFVKQYIDMLAFYKFNTFHWHLTDDQGWRIEIKKYPLLTAVGAYRSGSMIGAYSNQQFDDLPYGGFYTQNEIREIVNYAQQRHITILPEIEMPGHSQAAIASYPWLGCTGKKTETAKSWGVFENVFCSKDSTFNFIKDVLDEVITLFPGEYIHIGGDECPKVQWKNCSHCQKRIKNEGLKNEEELQSYFVKRVATYLKTKKRSIVGWDEIMEGGLAPGATVMSWRGFEGGLEAAMMKHNVIMTPGSHCYFDHYQAQPNGEPLAIGGYTPIDKVYNFEPVPDTLKEEFKKYIIGAQANVWTEYITTEEHLEYMVNPRMAALAEVLWTKKNNKNESDFLRRVQNHFYFYEVKEQNYSKALYDVNFRINNSNSGKGLILDLQSNRSLGTIFYTFDKDLSSANWKPYTAPLAINESLKFGAKLKTNLKEGKILQRELVVNKATGKEITFVQQPSKYYKGDGSFTLVNGIKGEIPRINQEWLGWIGSNMEAVLDLKEALTVYQVSVGFLKEELNWIYLPKEIEVMVSSDGQNFTSVAKLNAKEIEEQGRFVSIKTNSNTVRYVKVLAVNAGKIQSGKPGAGEDSWLFCDEIIIE